ncbi:MAG TPA: hypothetical protein P5056_00895 [Candidatus Paceibacterota bacterium]|nr:hypothetical protein [Candidatus Paceibacterota bacterium]
MKRFLFFALCFTILVSMNMFVITASHAEGDYSSFIDDDKECTAVIHVSDHFASPRIHVMDLVIKKAWWVKNNPDKKIISTHFIYDKEYIIGLWIDYEIKQIGDAQ